MNSNRVHVCSKDGVKTNGRTDTTDCITFPANAVGNNDGVNEIKQSGLYGRGTLGILLFIAGR